MRYHILSTAFRNPNICKMVKFLLTCLACCIITSSVSANVLYGNGKKSTNTKRKAATSIKSRKVPGGKATRYKAKKKNSRHKKSPNLGRIKEKKTVELDNFSRNKGTFNFPLEEGIVKTAFGPYKVGESEIIGYNPGLTLEAIQGSCVHSVFEGVVTRLFEIEGNWAVTVQHGNYLTVYSNLASVTVTQDEKIASGTILGRAACNTNGNAELEFLLMKNNKNIDPAPWIRK